MTSLRNSLLALTVLALLAGCAGPAGKPTPQRPTFSKDTRTTQAGTVELEAGIDLDPGDFFDTPVALKFGMSDSTELFIESAPYQWIELPGSDGNGIGDTTVGVRDRIIDLGPDEPAIAYQLSTKIPTAPEGQGLTNNEIDFFAAAIADTLVGEDLNLTFFYQLGLLGDPGGGDPDIQHGLAFAGSMPVAESFGVYGEIAGVFTPERDIENVFTTGGVTYPLMDGVTLDGGVAIGLSRDAADLRFLLGITTNFGGLGTQ